MYMELMLQAASGMKKSATWYNPMSWFKGKQNMPVSHYNNRMTGQQVSNQQMGGLKNSIPQSHYMDRLPEETMRGQMGLSPGSYRAYVRAQNELSHAWDPDSRAYWKAQAMNANTPGPHQRMWNDHGARIDYSVRGPFNEDNVRGVGYFPINSYKGPAPDFYDPYTGYAPPVPGFGR